jgi:uncharacterized protein YkwD
MGSPGHRSNIRTCGYRYPGVGLAFDGAHRPYRTQDFDRPT